MEAYPLFGIGPGNFLPYSPFLGWATPKYAHTTWLTYGAEVGLPGLIFILLFYGVCMFRLVRYVWERAPVIDPWFYGAARMVFAGLVGFMVSAQFVAVAGIELPYYICLLGAAILKVQDLNTGSGFQDMHSLCGNYSPRWGIQHVSEDK
jgi:O-antigen ligase